MAFVEVAITMAVSIEVATVVVSIVVATAVATVVVSVATMAVDFFVNYLGKIVCWIIRSKVEYLFLGFECLQNEIKPVNLLLINFSQFFCVNLVN